MQLSLFELPESFASVVCLKLAKPMRLRLHRLSAKYGPYSFPIIVRMHHLDALFFDPLHFE